MLREGFTPAEVDCYFAKAGEELITKTHGRQATGGLNHLLGDLPYMEKIVVDGMYQPYMTDMVNDDLCHVALHPEFGYIEPRKFFVDRMREIVDATNR